MSDKEESYKRYKDILFAKKDIYKITNITSLHDKNIRFAYRYIRHLYTKANLSTGEIANIFEVNIDLINKIVAGHDVKLYEKPKKAILLDVEIRNNLLAICLKDLIGNNTFYTLINSFGLSPKEAETLLEKIYRLWQKLGTKQALVWELKIPCSKVDLLINFIKHSNIIKNVTTPKRKLSDEQKEKIIKTKKLYDELGTLAEVGKKIRLTRERVRQILERGNHYGIIEYKTTSLKGFDDLAKKLKKDELEKLIIKYGSKQKVIYYLKNKIKINMNYLNALINLYNIDFQYLLLQHKKNRCYFEYNEMVREIGSHPTTTVMNRHPKWRSLWSRISRFWGNINNFRKEFGIPIPCRGNPNFKEDTKRGREKYFAERQRIKSKKIQKIIQFIESNSPVTRRQIQIFLNVSPGVTDRFIKELVIEDKIDWMVDGNRYLYLKKI